MLPSVAAMKVLVTGGSGFIGDAVMRRLSSVGHCGSVFDQSSDPRDDITDVGRVREAARGHDAVIHLAGKVGIGVGTSDLDSYVRANDLGTAAVLRAAAEEDIGRVVLASSMVVYGEGARHCPDHGPVSAPARDRADLDRGDFEPRCRHCGAELGPALVTEASGLDPRSTYAATKVQLEQLARIWARETTGRAVALRYHNVYGPGLPIDTPYAGVAALFRSVLEQGRAPRVFEDGRQQRDFVHVNDVASATVAALDVGPDADPGFQALNIGSGQVTTIGEMAATLARIAEGPEPVVTGEYRLGDVRHITADSSAARSVLGWEPAVVFEDGLHDIFWV